MLRRKAYRIMEDWKNAPRRTALLIDGVRQVGKTYLVREFAREHYGSFLEINFVESPSAKAIFEGDLDAATLVAGLTAWSNMPLTPGDTLVFLDEIQACPKARTAIKFLVDDGRFDYVESGSLLGVSYNEPPSLPVGYETLLRMFPLTFTEFCWALGVPQETVAMARSCIEEGVPVPEAIHDRLMKYFNYYSIVGGMPAVVSEFAATQDLARCRATQKSIVALYRQDIARYADDKMHVHAIFDAIPSELNKANKRFKLADISKAARMNRYANDFVWLEDSGVGLPCYNVEAPTAPLALNEKHSVFKLYLCDTGLLNAMYADALPFELLKGDYGFNWGAVLENLCAQMLAANGFALRYYDSAKFGELDFVVERKGKALPIEAKSGDSYKRHISIDKALSVLDWRIDHAVVACKSNVSIETVATDSDEKVVTYVPWYALEFLEPDKMPESFIVEL
jgi:hypothetical protein